MPWIGQFRYLNILTWLRALAEYNKRNELLIPHPRSDFFCFIPLSLGTKLEFWYIGNGLLNICQVRYAQETQTPNQGIAFGATISDLLWGSVPSATSSCAKYFVWSNCRIPCHSRTTSFMCRRGLRLDTTSPGKGQRGLRLDTTPPGRGQRGLGLDIASKEN